MYLAKEWKNNNENDQFPQFKNSKGWCDKVMRRNHQLFENWKADKADNSLPQYIENENNLSLTSSALKKLKTDETQNTG